MLKRTSVSVTEEKRICIGLMVSTEFWERIEPIFKLEYFTNSYLKILSSWCSSFFDQYRKAPFLHIKDIFESQKNKLSETESEMIEVLISDLDKNYSRDDINVDYWFEQATDYFRGRELEIAVNNISVLKENGEIEEAEQEIENFKNISAKLSSNLVINPGKIEIQEAIYEKISKTEKGFFKLPGDLGKYLGNLKRGDFVVFQAPAKRGKSFSLVNFLKYGILSRKKTLFFSIEMLDTEIVPRLNKALNPMIDVEEFEENKVYQYPVFDCALNQTGMCADRNSSVTVLVDKKVIPNPTHIICTKCRNHPDMNQRKRFVMSTFFESIKRESHDIFSIRKNFKSNAQLLDKYCRISVHPKYSLTYEKMIQDVENLWVRERWAPDITIIDYVDILGINSKFDDFRLDDEKFKILAQYGGKYNNLVITATQANKAGHTSDVLDATHLGGFYGKNRHVTLMVGLNQNAVDKEQGIIRFGITEARFRKYIPGKTCAVLQDLQTGQAYLDSHYGN